MSAVETWPIDVLGHLARSEAVGRVLRREHRGRVIRWRIAEFAPRRYFGGPHAVPSVRLVRLDDGSRTQPAGTSEWLAAGALLDSYRLYRLEKRR